MGWFVFSFLLFGVIKAKRMNSPGPNKLFTIVHLVISITGWILTWFILYGINLAFWIGFGIIIFGLVIFSLGYAAMREHPEKKQAVVDWGIYKVSRHSHVLASDICLLGVVIMGWNPSSNIYIILWVYFVLYVVIMHFGVLNEEKLNMERFGQDYVDYMNRVPRYLFYKI